MSIADQLAKVEPYAYHRGTFDERIADLPQVDQEAIKHSLSDPDLPLTKIYEILRANGVKLGMDMLRRQRKALTNGTR